MAAWRCRLSDDGRQIAVRVDVPENRVLVRSVAVPREPEISLSLGKCYPDQILLLQSGGDLVTLERRETKGGSCISLWSVNSGKLVVKHEFDYMTVNSICRTAFPHSVALGLDQSVAILNVDSGTIQSLIEIESRPVRRCAFDPQSGRVGVLTDEDLMVIDIATMRTLKTLKHFGSKGVICHLRRHVMAAIVISREGKTNLHLWDLAGELGASTQLL